MKLLSKIPSRQEILPVFSLILFIVFSWTIYRMLFQIPSWLYSHTKSGIFFLAAYVFAFALFESVLLLAFILIINFVLPRYLFRDWFIAQSSLVILASTGWALIVQFQRESLSTFDLPQLIAWIVLYLLSLLLMTFVFYILLRKYVKVKTIVETIADRMVVFAWLYVPVGLVSLVIVVIRNII